MNLRLGKVSVLYGLTCLVLAMVSPVGHGAVTVSVSSEAAGGGSYNYEFSIVNTGPENIAALIIDGPKLDTNIASSLGAPEGARAVYGAAEGALVLLRGVDMVFDANTTTMGFTVNSLSPPESAPFKGFQAIPTTGGDILGSVEIEGLAELIFADSFDGAD